MNFVLSLLPGVETVANLSNGEIFHIMPGKRYGEQRHYTSKGKHINKVIESGQLILLPQRDREVYADLP